MGIEAALLSLGLSALTDTTRDQVKKLVAFTAAESAKGMRHS